MMTIFSNLPGRLSRLSRLAAVALFGGALAGPAMAEPQFIGSAYIESVVRNCPNPSICTVSFTAITPGGDLLVRNVSCRISAGRTSQIYNFHLLGNATKTWLTVESVGQGTKMFFSTNNDVYTPIGSGQQPEIFIQLSGNTTSTLKMECTISGEFLPFT